ncbi:hypothetical protein QE152_g27469 [Popillia japonica]|uniref:Uncharacterized protein n=1 Tax=Popillia japonica TaxID=7064 RepID=A0AAW1JW63_POPJA
MAVDRDIVETPEDLKTLLLDIQLSELDEWVRKADVSEEANKNSTNDQNISLIEYNSVSVDEDKYDDEVITIF